MIENLVVVSNIFDMLGAGVQAIVFPGVAGEKVRKLGALQVDGKILKRVVATVVPLMSIKEVVVALYALTRKGPSEMLNKIEKKHG